MRKPELSIIVPTLDEGPIIQAFLERLLAAKGCKNAQILVVDGGSSDHTRDETLSFSSHAKNVEFIEAPPGKGMGARIGFSKAKGKYVVLIDADLQYPPEEIPRVVSALKYADLVVTKRKSAQFGHRRLLSLGFSQIIGKGLLSLPSSDPQSGLKGMRASLLKKIQLSSRHFEFDAELIRKAQEAGAKIKEIEIAFHPRLAGRAKTGVFSTAANLFGGAVGLAFSKHR